MKFMHVKILGWLILLLCSTGSILGQGHAKNWYFGNGAGLVFEGRYPLPLTDGQISSKEGVASISDSLGNLVMYTNGKTVWNYNHEIIANDLPGDPNSSMAATIVPNRLKEDQYFIFTTSVIISLPEGPQVPDGGLYYLFDFSSENPGGKLIASYLTMGNGEVVQPLSVEKFLAIPYPDENIADTLDPPGYWLVTHEFDKFTFRVSKFDEGLRSFTPYEVGKQHSNSSTDFGANKGAGGYVAVSLQGDKIAVAIEGQNMFEVFKFDIKTGQIGRRLMQLPAGDPDHKKSFLHDAYGVAFSPSGRFLYGTSRDEGILYQWDFLTMNTLEEVYILRHNPDIPCGALQLAPNGKIYLSIKDQDYVGVLNRPDRLGKRAAFEEYGARLIDNETGEGGKGTLGLPQFDMRDFRIQHFNYDHNCLGDTTIMYMAGATPSGYSFNGLKWTIKDPVSGGIYTEIYPDEYLMGSWVFPAAGDYDVLVEGRYKGQAFDNYVERITIYEPQKVRLAELDYTIMCRGDTMILDAGDAAFYEWADESFRERRYTVTEEDFAIGLIQEYRVKATDYRGCVAWDTIQVELKNPPKVEFEYTTAVCGEPTGSALVIPSGKIENYFFSWEDFPDNTSNKLEGVLGGDYVVYVTSRFAGCRASFVAHVPSLGGASIQIVPSTPDTVCIGTPVSLSVIGEGVSEYQWINPSGSTDSLVNVFAFETKEYEVLVISRDDQGNECPTTASYTIHVFPENKPELGSDKTACEGETITITAPDGYASYLWNNGLTGQTIELYEGVNELALIATDFHNCSYSDTIFAVFHSPPDVNLGADQTLCSAGGIELSGGKGDSYLWSTGETSEQILVDTSGTYILEIQEFGCPNRDTVEIYLLNPDLLQFDSIGIKDVSCFGANNGQIEIQVQGSGSSYEYSIDGGNSFYANDGRFKNLVPGSNYEAWVREDSLCSKSYPELLEINEPEEISFSFQMNSPSCPECNDGSIILVGLRGGTEPYTIQWSTLDFGERLTGVPVGLYSVFIKDSLNCTQSDHTYLDLGFKIPNAFSPNGDGINESWEIKLLENYKQLVIRIFDSKGLLVFESPEGYPEPWDGSFEGQPLPMGTYYYLIYLTPDQKPLTGNLTLLR